MAEFAVLLPVLVGLAAVAFNAVALAAVQVRIQSLAAAAVRVAARGDALSESMRTELDEAGTSTFSIDGDLMSVRIDHQGRFMRVPITMTARATARSEVSTNDFEQD